jgi:hypothetical protein
MVTPANVQEIGFSLWKKLTIPRTILRCVPPDGASSDQRDRTEKIPPRPPPPCTSSLHVAVPHNTCTLSLSPPTSIFSFIPNRETELACIPRRRCSPPPYHEIISFARSRCSPPSVARGLPCHQPQAGPAAGLKLALPPISSTSGEASLPPTSGENRCFKVASLALRSSTRGATTLQRWSPQPPHRCYRRGEAVARRCGEGRPWVLRVAPGIATCRSRRCCKARR